MTSATVKTQPQIFLSFARSDRALAEKVNGALREAGVKVVRMDELRAGGEYTNSVREALHESDAVVVALSSVSRRHDVPASVLFEIGAAVGAAKRIFVVVEDATTKLPFTAPQLEILPANRVNEIADRLSAHS
jgi:nucleoside 2-deoxyribosyltransferase